MENRRSPTPKKPISTADSQRFTLHQGGIVMGRREGTLEGSVMSHTLIIRPEAEDDLADANPKVFDNELQMTA